MTCVALLGGDGGDAWPLADISIVIPSSDSQRIQEAHLLVLHLLCELVETGLAADHWNQPAVNNTTPSLWSLPTNGKTKANGKAKVLVVAENGKNN